MDLSADFRLRDLASIEQWYGAHTAPELLPQAVYGLTEVYRAQVAGARWWPTRAAIPPGRCLALRPLLRAGRRAGRPGHHRRQVGRLGRGRQAHRRPPISSTCTTTSRPTSRATSTATCPRSSRSCRPLRGQPLRASCSRRTCCPSAAGILSTIYVSLDPTWRPGRGAGAVAADLWRRAVRARACPRASWPRWRHVVDTNRCALSVASAGAPGELIVVTAIDNLIKGASGQAVQNMNVMFGLDETHGLDRLASQEERA